MLYTIPGIWTLVIAIYLLTKRITKNEGGTPVAEQPWRCLGCLQPRPEHLASGATQSPGRARDGQQMMTAVLGHCHPCRDLH